MNILKIIFVESLVNEGKDDGAAYYCQKQYIFKSWLFISLSFIKNLKVEKQSDDYNVSLGAHKLPFITLSILA